MRVVTPAQPEARPKLSRQQATSASVWVFISCLLAAFCVIGGVWLLAGGAWALIAVGVFLFAFAGIVVLGLNG